MTTDPVDAAAKLLRATLSTPPATCHEAVAVSYMSIALLTKETESLAGVSAIERDKAKGIHPTSEDDYSSSRRSCESTPGRTQRCGAPLIIGHVIYIDRAYHPTLVASNQDESQEKP